MVTTIVTAIFPIYFSSVAAAGLAPSAATLRFGIATTIGLVAIALSAPVLGAISDHTGKRKRMLAAFLGVGAGAVALMFFVGRGDWLLASALFILANIGANGSFVFYDAMLPARRETGGDRPRVDGGIRARVRRRGRLAGPQSGLDPEACLVRASLGARPIGRRCDASRAPGLPVGGGLVAALLDTALSVGSGATGVTDAGGREETSGGRLRASARLAARSALLSPSRPHAARLSDLQRRNRDDHPDGRDLRHGDRHRPRRADRFDPRRAVRRDPVLLPLRGARGPDRAEAIDPSWARRLCLHQRPRLLHDERLALSAPRGARRNRPGRDAGAEPQPLRELDPARPFGGVLRLLGGRREVRGYLRARALRSCDRAQRIEPPRDSLGDRLLPDRRDPARAGGRRGGAPERRGEPVGRAPPADRGATWGGLADGGRRNRLVGIEPRATTPSQGSP